MNNNKMEFTNEQTVQLVNAIRAGIEKTKHHQRYSARVEAAIKQEVEKIFPGIVMHFGAMASSLGGITAWGGSSGVGYEQRFHSCWNWNNGDGKHWSAPILVEMQRCDVSDVIEREAQENVLDLQFSRLEVQAREAARKLEEIRSHARKLCADLPLPKSATLRDKPRYWDGPTSATAKRYGALFGKIELAAS